MVNLDEITVAEKRSMAMGSTMHVMVVGTPTATEAALSRSRDRVEELEQCWSRFRPESELSRLNASRGRTVEVSDDMATLLVELERAWRTSNGVFDPTLGSTLAAHGYDRPFVDLVRGGSYPAPGQVSGRQLDAGGLGKGLAADLVVDELLRRPGIEGALVSIGGDLRCDGRGPGGEEWAIEVGDVVAGVPNEVLVLARGAVATSTPARRRWRTASGWAHHLIDADTAAPAVDPPVAVTVVTDRAVDAEWVATSIASGGRSLLYRLDGDFVVLVTEADGTRIERGPIEEFRQ